VLATNVRFHILMWFKGAVESTMEWPGGLNTRLVVTQSEFIGVTSI
jgi:hypothetical protein